MEEAFLVSCLCITRSRPALFLRAVDCFRNQTYKNRELIVIYEDDDQLTHEAVQTVVDENIFFRRVTSSPKNSLGNLRNIAIDTCNGEYFCQWDDDDWYHNSRIEMQVRAALTNHKTGSILLHWIMYDCNTQQAYMSARHSWEGSLLCEKKVSQIYSYPDLNRREDTPFIQSLIQNNLLYPVISPTLYIYTHHGRNSWSEKHFNSLCSRGSKLLPGATEVVGKILNGHYSNAEASRILFCGEFLKDLNYFSSPFVKV